MEQQSRRGLLKNAAKAAVAVTGGAMLAPAAKAQVTGKLEKKTYPPKTQATRSPPHRRKSLSSPARLLRQSALSRRCRSALQGHDRRAHEARAR